MENYELKGQLLHGPHETRNIDAIICGSSMVSAH